MGFFWPFHMFFWPFGVAFGLLGFAFSFGCYVVPTIVAVARRHRDTPGIAVVNILFGWSVIGWILALIWALSDPAGRLDSYPAARFNTTAPYVPPVSSSAPAASHPSGMSAADDPDTTFWDSAADKTDPDHLEEYLVRFPDGRFAELARTRLQRR